jgi:hypothetical protein
VRLDVGDGVSGVEGFLGKVSLDLHVQLLALINNGLNLSKRGGRGGGGDSRRRRGGGETDWVL